MAGEGSTHLLGLVLPALGAALNVGEQEGDCAGWRVLHKHHHSF